MRLHILELDLVPRGKFGQPAGMDLQNVSGWLTGSIGGTPGARQNSIHNGMAGIYPDYCQVHINKKHVDGCVEAAITRFDQQQTFSVVQAGTAHQTAQAAKETVTINCLQWRRQWFILVFDANDFHK